MKDCPEGAVFLAAVSGGADSMAMLAALCAVIGSASSVPTGSSVPIPIPTERLFCLHVEHGLRPAEESCGDAGYVRDFCKRSGISCRVESVPQGKIASYARHRGIGIEAAARFFRRRALLREAARLGDNALILTAHTRDDALELALMRVLRGAGSAGLAAMPVRKGRFLRPLLFIDRADVIGYLTEKKITYREDSTNTDEKFLRNRVRRRLVPLLNEFFPSWKSGLSGMAATQSLAAAFLTEEASRRVVWEREKGAFVTGAENFFSQPQIIREEALFQGITQNLKTSSVPKRSVIRRFCSGSVPAAELGSLLRVRHEGEKVALSPVRKDFSETGFSLLIKEPGLYNLINRRINIEVRQFSAQNADSGFFACLPLIFRRTFKDDFLVSRGKKVKKRDLAERRLVSAVDRLGTAAFIGSQGLLFARDIPQFGGEIFLVTVRSYDCSFYNGGADV
ncbi:MAG: tRNA lysidine(34) synthetase TilS [Treponema sp.]|nr:tRNA lysidine(34) synthetase TilS [Treponema sp.]